MESKFLKIPNYLGFEINPEDIVLTINKEIEALNNAYRTSYKIFKNSDIEFSEYWSYYAEKIKEIFSEYWSYHDIWFEAKLEKLIQDEILTGMYRGELELIYEDLDEPDEDIIRWYYNELIDSLIDYIGHDLIRDGCYLRSIINKNSQKKLFKVHKDVYYFQVLESNRIVSQHYLTLRENRWRLLKIWDAVGVFTHESGFIYFH